MFLKKPRFLKISFGIILIIFIGMVFKFILSPGRVTLPQGWMIIRPPYEVSALLVKDNIIWAGGRDGLYKIDRETGTLISLPEEIPDFHYIKDLILDSQENLWIAHRDGLTCLKQKKWKTYTKADGLLPGPVTALLIDQQGHFWIGGEAGLMKFNGTAFQTVTGDGLSLSSVDVIFQDSTGALWFGSGSPTRGGLYRLEGNTWSFFSSKSELTHDTINDIEEDAEGRIWIGTGFASRGGACQYFNGSWSHITRKDGLAGERVTSIYKDFEKRLWFGSEFDGAAIFDGEHWFIITPKNGLAGWDVKAMLQDEDGVYWLGTEKGLNRIEKIDWVSLREQ